MILIIKKRTSSKTTTININIKYAELSILFYTS